MSETIGRSIGNYIDEIIEYIVFFILFSLNDTKLVNSRVYPSLIESAINRSECESVNSCWAPRVANSSESTS